MIVFLLNLTNRFFDEKHTGVIIKPLRDVNLSFLFPPLDFQSNILKTYRETKVEGFQDPVSKNP